MKVRSILTTEYFEEDNLRLLLLNRTTCPDDAWIYPALAVIRAYRFIGAPCASRIALRICSILVFNPVPTHCDRVGIRCPAVIRFWFRRAVRRCGVTLSAIARWQA